MSVPGRIASISLLVVAAAAFALSIGGGRWWVIGSSFDIGPLGTRQCSIDGDCVPAQFPLDAGPRFERAATATAAAGVIAMVVLLGLAGGLAAGRQAKLVRRMAMTAAATAIVASALFVTAFPDLPGADMGRGIALYGVGIICTGLALIVARAASRSSSASA